MIAAGAEASTSLLALSQCLHTACRLMAREILLLLLLGTRHRSAGAGGVVAVAVVMHSQSSNKETIAGVPQNRALCSASCQGTVTREGQSGSSKCHHAACRSTDPSCWNVRNQLAVRQSGPSGALWHVHDPLCRVALPPGLRPTDPCSTAVGMRAYSTPVLNHRLDKHSSIE